MLNFKDLLAAPVQQFIRDHENDDPRELVLKQKNIQNVPSSLVADQIKGRKKAKEKLPDWYTSSGIIFPPSVNLEQSSSQVTANFKKIFLQKHLSQFNSCVDLTGGFGVDCFYLSQLFQSVLYIETQNPVLEIAQHNHAQLGSTNITHQKTSAESFLKSTTRTFDLLFVDPSRRVAGNRKVHSFKDSEPDVIDLHDLMLNASENILIKASPLLDIQQSLKDLRSVKSVVIVSVNNECKELLFLLGKKPFQETKIEAVNILDNNSFSSFSFLLSEENESQVRFSDPLAYLYEPNASILKGGAFKLIANRFNVFKLHPSTHFYASDNLISDFPGRIFKILATVKADEKAVKQFVTDGHANVITRNYPLRADDLRKKLRLKDGGKKYVIGFAGPEKKYLVIADRLQ